MSTPAVQTAEQVAAALEGLSLEQIFHDGPRRLFIEREIPRHGTYRLYISRPFGVTKPGGLRWRVQLTVQYDGQDVAHPLNDGRLQAPLAQLGAVIREAAEQLDAHAQHNRQLVAKARREAIRQVRPEALEVV